MPESDVRRGLHDLLSAFGLLTRLPLPRASLDMGHSARSAWAWPLVGLVVGGIGAVIGATAMALGLPAAPAAALALTAMVLVTGGLHEDGLADTADGLWGGATRDRRLEIMRDSRIGSYGMLALALALILRWSLIWVLALHGAWISVVVAAVLSRAAMTVLSSTMPFARSDGLSRATGRPSARVAMAAAGVAVLIGAISVGWAVVTTSLAASLAGIWLRQVAMARIHGQTGDILGAGQQVTELAALLVLAARPS